MVTKLMSWFLPKGGTVLVLGFGSGAEVVAAVAAGFSALGVESDAKQHQSAVRRVQGFVSNMEAEVAAVQAEIARVDGWIDTCFSGIKRGEPAPVKGLSVGPAVTPSASQPAASQPSQSPHPPPPPSEDYAMCRWCLQLAPMSALVLCQLCDSYIHADPKLMCVVPCAKCIDEEKVAYCCEDHHQSHTLHPIAVISNLQAAWETKR